MEDDSVQGRSKTVKPSTILNYNRFAVVLETVEAFSNEEIDANRGRTGSRGNRNNFWSSTRNIAKTQK
jgi:hypothetical protein